MDAKRRIAVVPWLIRITWLLVPFTVGPAIADGLVARESLFRSGISSALWVFWAILLMATLIPHPLSLTVLRVGTPVLVLTALACVARHWGILGVAGAIVPTIAVFTTDASLHYINGISYPNERRFPLRPPGWFLVSLIPVAWVLTVGAPIGAYTLVLQRHWIVGAIALVLALPISAVLLRSLHGLSRRWVVFVPAGVVLHDAMSLVDPVLFTKDVIAGLGPADAQTDALDLTSGALGLALELDLTEKVPMVRKSPEARNGESGASARLLFIPSRAAAVMREARERRISVS